MLGHTIATRSKFLVALPKIQTPAKKMLEALLKILRAATDKISAKDSNVVLLQVIIYQYVIFYFSPLFISLRPLLLSSLPFINQPSQS